MEVIDNTPIENSPHTSLAREVSEYDGEDSFPPNNIDEKHYHNRSDNPDRYGLICKEECNESFSDELTLEDALRGSEKEQWEQSVKEELKSFEDNNAWEVVDVPASGNIVKCKWVIKKKCNNKVLKLKKAIYGLEEASCAWHKKVNDCMLGNGYVKSKIKLCLYIKAAKPL